MFFLHNITVEKVITEKPPHRINLIISPQNFLFRMDIGFRLL